MPRGGYRPGAGRPKGAKSKLRSNMSKKSKPDFNKIKDLNPSGYNPRKITKKQLNYLNRSMQEFGDLSGIIVNVRTGNVIGGHQRIKNLNQDWEIEKQPLNDLTGTIAAGHINTPFGKWTYREVDWDVLKEKAANLAANKHGGEWDLPKLDVIINELREIDFDLELTGFDFSKHKNDDDNNLDAIGEIQYQIIVKCEDEKEQIQIIQELEERGISCQPLIL